MIWFLIGCLASCLNMYSGPAYPFEHFSKLRARIQVFSSIFSIFRWTVPEVRMLQTKRPIGVPIRRLPVQQQCVFYYSSTCCQNRQKLNRQNFTDSAGRLNVLPRSLRTDLVGSFGGPKNGHKGPVLLHGIFHKNGRHRRLKHKFCAGNHVIEESRGIR